MLLPILVAEASSDSKAIVIPSGTKRLVRTELKSENIFLLPDRKMATFVVANDKLQALRRILNPCEGDLIDPKNGLISHGVTAVLCCLNRKRAVVTKCLHRVALIMEAQTIGYFS